MSDMSGVKIALIFRVVLQESESILFVLVRFRHPLGISFWHTAVLPHTRDWIGRTLAGILLAAVSEFVTTSPAGNRRRVMAV